MNEKEISEIEKQLREDITNAFVIGQSYTREQTKRLIMDVLTNHPLLQPEFKIEVNKGDDVSINIIITPLNEIAFRFLNRGWRD